MANMPTEIRLTAEDMRMGDYYTPMFGRGIGSRRFAQTMHRGMIGRMIGWSASGDRVRIRFHDGQERFYVPFTLMHVDWSPRDPQVPM